MSDKRTKVEVWTDPRQSYQSAYMMLDAGDRPVIIFDPAKRRLWIKGPHADVEYTDVIKVTVGE